MKKIDILEYFPINIKNILNRYINDDIKKLEEIRIRKNQKILLKFIDKEMIINYIISKEDIDSIMEKICDNSIYSYQREIVNGYITLKNGDRVGIVGKGVMENEKLINIKDIYSLNFRIAKYIKDVSLNVLEHILDIENNLIYNTMIVSIPGVGKTTILRDLIIKLSNGIDNVFRGINVGVVDERGELTNLNNLSMGIRTDILENVSKSIGMNILVRTMSPKVIVVDEIGNKEDIEAIRYLIYSGVKGIFTAHGNSLEDIMKNNLINILIKEKLVNRIILLDEKNKGKIKQVIKI